MDPLDDPHWLGVLGGMPGTPVPGKLLPKPRNLNPAVFTRASSNFDHGLKWNLKLLLEAKPWAQTGLGFRS